MKKFFQSPWSNTRAVALAYATVIFSVNPWVGFLLCLASLLVPWTGLTGIAGTIIALVAARRAGFERAAIDDGRLLFNSLLCSLAVGCWAPPGALPPFTFAMLLVLVSLAALGCTLILNQITLVLVGTASRSLAYCVVATGLNWLLTRMIFVPATPAGVLFPSWQFPLPQAAEWWTRALGAIFFAPTALAGLIVTLALALASRLSLLHALLGYAISAAFLQGLGFPLAQSYWLQLDAILCAVALGGVFFVPSRASLALAAVGAGLCTVTGVALMQGLRWIDAPVLTLPFNLVVLGVAGAMRWRVAGSEPRAVLYPGKTPEATFQADHLWAARNPEPYLPAIAAPFDGPWVVTQGFDGEPTHRGAWRHALDFELADASRHPARPASASLEDFPSFAAPVIAPTDGRVVRLVDDVADNDIGGNNLVENWGNSIVIEIAPQLYVQLSHFRRRGFKVREGDRVRQGQLLGYLGNSGRSPIPHLHLQMQTQPDIGAPTIPFRLRGYRTPAEAGRWQYHFRGLPAKSQILSGCRHSRWLEECFASGPEFERTYRVFTARGEEPETIRHTLAADGSLLLQSLEKKTRVRLLAREDHLTPVDFHGSRKSLLAAFGTGGRIPLASVPGLHWPDAANPAFCANTAGKIFSDVLGPFLRQPLATCEGTLISSDVHGKKFAIRWTTPGNSTTELGFAAGLGLVSGRTETRRSWMRFLATAAAPETFAPAVAAKTPSARAQEYALI